jgi:predicted small lipoprotein YifL
MIARAVLVLVALALAGCGVKTQLEPPPGAVVQKGQPDPSKPPKPLGQ